ncbi:hypothetical protein ACFX15_002466 [Malus domestica]
MESLVDGVSSLLKICYYAPPDVGNNPSSTTGTARPSQPPSPKQSRSEGVLSPSCVTAHSYSQEAFLHMGKHYHSSNKRKLEHGGPNDVLNKSAETSYLNKVSMVEAKTSDKNPPSRVSPTHKSVNVPAVWRSLLKAVKSLICVILLRAERPASTKAALAAMLAMRAIPVV